MMTAATEFDSIDSIEIGLNKGQEFKKENANFSKFWDAFLDNILKVCLLDELIDLIKNHYTKIDIIN